jgi:hypothetical protein
MKESFEKMLLAVMSIIITLLIIAVIIIANLLFKVSEKEKKAKRVCEDNVVLQINEKSVICKISDTVIETRSLND